MIDLKSIKLIIWDLDETFWNGTLSEGGVHVPEENIHLLRDLTDCGIINSICSKNEWGPTKEYLQGLGVWDLFVFPSINWDSKGIQLKEKLDKMALRPVNVLFLDDNPSNLGEARHFLPDIQTAGPDAIPDIIFQVESIEKKDVQHERLHNYKILEEKDTVSRSYESNEAFLYDSNIRLEIHKDCRNQIRRIHELLLRSNQLNYTKKRIDLEALEIILQSPEYDCGYVTVKDRFGDYGIVGFYALKEKRLEHFFFSCRTMGQRIEQWVYAKLGFPELTIVGDVRSRLNQNDCPGWINQEKVSYVEEQEEERTKARRRILLKGPCDLSHSLVYIKGSDRFDTEFTYISNKEGQIIDAHNHSVHILGLHTYSEKDKEDIVRDCFFVDPAMLTGSFFTKKYDLIVLSTLIESTYQIYQKKGTDIRVVFGGLDMTDSNNWDAYINKKTYTGENNFTEEFLQAFSENYECIGLTTPEMYESFLYNCLLWLPEKTSLCLILGATRFYEGQEEVKSRHLAINEVVKRVSKKSPRIRFIELDDCIHNSADFDGEINHFTSRVYYELGLRIIQIIQDVTGQKVKPYSSAVLAIDNLTLKLRKILKSIIRPDSLFYDKLKGIYNIVYKHRK